MAFWFTFVRVSGLQRVEKAWLLHSAIRREFDMIDGECELRSEDIAELLEETVESKVGSLRTLRRSVELLDTLRITPDRLGSEAAGTVAQCRKFLRDKGDIMDVPEDAGDAAARALADWALVCPAPASPLPLPADEKTARMPVSSSPAGALLGRMILAQVEIVEDDDVVEQITARALLAIEQRRAVRSSLKGIEIFCRLYHRRLTRTWREMELLYQTAEATLLPHGALSRFARRLGIGDSPERRLQEVNLFLPLLQSAATLMRVLDTQVMDPDGRLREIA